MGGTFLFGGCGLGAPLAVVEAVTGRPALWATAHYVGRAPVGATLDIEVDVVRRGRAITHARARCTVDGDEALTVMAACGETSGGGSTFLAPPDVPRPQDCPTQGRAPWWGAGVLDRFEARLAVGTDADHLAGAPTDGHLAVWVRLPDRCVPPTGVLAVLADMLSGAQSHARGGLIGAPSLDNTIRAGHPVATEWVLFDMQVLASAQAFGSGAGTFWSDDGTLLATASTSNALARPAP